jgi:cell fate (sporulation/competence/biofilm development) regulator YlbF (YheA/YmcA/DUF963 family)
MIFTGDYEEDYASFREEFLSSAPVQALKEADRKLDQDPVLLSLYQKKQDLGAALAQAIRETSGKEEELKAEFTEVNAEISSLPEVADYEAKYRAVSQIKLIFEKEILRRLA